MTWCMIHAAKCIHPYTNQVASQVMVVKTIMMVLMDIPSIPSSWPLTLKPGLPRICSAMHE